MQNNFFQDGAWTIRHDVHLFTPPGLFLLGYRRMLDSKCTRKFGQIDMVKISN